ncbi:uncharacterized protein B0H64DRAFT_473702 [Chaetomium fimeti]|uniref:Uncharacterized protein n=1 Tax=Chaetomium fimeti TaxID=1854472 RepID=A0AAE0LTW4_9PEZI|nr:hypothetical protein B0H64DRAFT_473702 [Chaetomium fimeti]
MLAESPWTMQYRMNYTRDHVYGGHKPSGRPYKAAARVPEGQFDPNELTRRLYVVLAEQKVHAERRRRARGETSNQKDGHGQVSSSRSKEARQKAAEPPADLITELRRTESTKHKPSHPATAGPGPDSQSEAYRHVPQEAAKQFTRTTTVENMRDTSLIHKLSKHALKFHLEGPKSVRPGGGSNGAPEPALAPGELTRALQQTQTQRNQLLDRNQFQRTRTLEEAARLEHPHPHAAPRRTHTLEDELSRILPGSSSHHSSSQAKHLRRNSTGNTVTTHPTDNPATTTTTTTHARHSLIASTAAPDTLVMDTLLEDDSTTTTTGGDEEGDALGLGRFAAAERARVDWTQSDEAAGRVGGGGHSHSHSHSHARATGGGPKLLLLSPLLRKADSLWTLRGRRGSKDSSGGEEVQSPTTPTAAAAAKGKGFFGRFKR